MVISHPTEGAFHKTSLNKWSTTEGVKKARASQTNHILGHAAAQLSCRNVCGFVCNLCQHSQYNQSLYRYEPIVFHQNYPIILIRSTKLLLLQVSMDVYCIKIARERNAFISYAKSWVRSVSGSFFTTSGTLKHHFLLFCRVLRHIVVMQPVQCL